MAVITQPSAHLLYNQKLPSLCWLACSNFV